MVIQSDFSAGEFCWVDLASHDMAAAATFYSEVFGWKQNVQDTRGGPPYAQFELDGAPVAGLGEMDDEMKSRGIPPMWNSYVNVEDIHETTAKAETLGAKIAVPVMQVMDAGWLSFIHDPNGASLGFWQKGEHCGAGRVNENGTCVWNELATVDVEASREFYGSLLGWEFADHQGTPTKYYIARDGETDRGGLMQMTEEWGEIPSHWCVYFAVENATESAGRVQSAGGTVRVPPFDTEVGPIAILGDPQGAGFNIIQKR